MPLEAIESEVSSSDLFHSVSHGGEKRATLGNAHGDCLNVFLGWFKPVGSDVCAEPGTGLHTL